MAFLLVVQCNWYTYEPVNFCCNVFEILRGSISLLHYILGCVQPKTIWSYLRKQFKVQLFRERQWRVSRKSKSGDEELYKFQLDEAVQSKHNLCFIISWSSLGQSHTLSSYLSIMLMSIKVKIHIKTYGPGMLIFLNYRDLSFTLHSRFTWETNLT